MLWGKGGPTRGGQTKNGQGNRWGGDTKGDSCYFWSERSEGPTSPDNPETTVEGTKRQNGFLR